MPKIAWAKHLYNAYHSIKMGDDVYDSNGNLLGQNDGFRARPTYKSPGSVCLVRKVNLYGFQEMWKKEKMVGSLPILAMFIIAMSHNNLSIY